MRQKDITPAQAAKVLRDLRKHVGWPKGKPRSSDPRCRCGANTLKRAEKRGFACCRQAGIKP